MKNLLYLISFVLLFSTCQSSEDIQNITVIGGGLMGSATAWQLSKNGEDVLLLEKQPEEYNSGSSYGEARIARSSNRENDIWSYLHNRSVKEVIELIEYLNSTERKEKYSIKDIYTTSPVTYIGRTKIYDKLYASLLRQEVNYKMAVTPEEGKKIFDVNLPDSVLIQKEYNLHSGTINPKILIKYLHKAIRKKGNQVSYQNQVTQIIPQKDYYEIKITDLKTNTEKTIKSRKIVSAAGPYTGSLLKEIAPYFEQLIQPQRVFLTYFKINPEKYKTFTDPQKLKIANAYPVINSAKGTRDGSFFSMIEYFDENENPVFKIGGHFQRSEIENLDDVWKKELSEDEIKWSRNNTLSYFNLINIPLTSDELELVKTYSCVYSLTASEVPLVTPIIQNDNQPNPNFLVLGGMSGVGGKGAMSYGVIAANILLEKSETDEMYQKVKEALGFERLLGDVKILEKEAVN